MPAHRTRDTQLPRSLEVTTESPQQQTPTLSIITPTPRAFTFPINKPIHESPYSSPSTSPFEPDLRPLALTPHASTTASPITPSGLPHPMMIRTLSPPSPLDSGSSSSPMAHKRRKSSSSAGDLSERRPKKGDEDYIKRPENAFILFRRKCCEERQAAHDEAAAADAPTKKQRQADLSKTISQQWKSLPQEERQYWEDLAKEKKKEHEALYPHYVYRPQRTTKSKESLKAKTRRMPFDGKQRGATTGSEYENETDTESVSFMLPFSGPLTRHGRSASAPTPPLGFQQIFVPNVYHPSCPTSPSLMPMIERRASHPGHPEGASRFDFLPTADNLMPPPSYPPDYRPDVASTEFFNNILGTTHERPSLHPLSMPTNETLLLPAHQLISPASTTSSSGPSSPHSEIYTPGNPFNSNVPQSGDCASMQASELQLDFDYPGYAWEPGMWPVAGEEVLGEDFDLASIPVLELGLSKMVDNSTAAVVSGETLFGHTLMDSGVYEAPRHESLDGLFDFEDMVASNGF